MKSPLAFIAIGAVGLAIACGAAWRMLGHSAPVVSARTSETRGAREATTSFHAVREREPAATPDGVVTAATTRTPEEATPSDFVVPPDVLVRAGADPDPVRRVEKILAALQEWAARDVEAAGAWALGHAPIPRGIAMAAVVRGAVKQDPAIAVRFVEQISAHDAERKTEYGGHLIFALSEVGEHRKAAGWAQSGDDDSALDWVTAAYDRWAAHDPEGALLSGAGVAEPLRRRAAVEAAVGAWARTQPRALAESAVGFPPGPERNLALVSALRAWVETDPDGAADWIQAHGPALTGLERLEIILEE